MLEWSSFEEEDEPEPIQKVIYRSPPDDFVPVVDGEPVFPTPPKERKLQKVCMVLLSCFFLCHVYPGFFFFDHPCMYIDASVSKTGGIYFKFEYSWKGILFVFVVAYLVHI